MTKPVIRTALTEPPLQSRFIDYFRLAAAFRDSKAMAVADLHQFEQIEAATRQYLDADVKGIRILEIGCGQRCGVSLLLGSSGATAIGIDTAFVGPLFSLFSPTVWRHGGIERTIQTGARRALFDHAYYKHLARLSGKRLSFSNTAIMNMDASQMDFADESFDFVYSCAAFEHIMDVPAAARESHRVLRKGGVAFISIHLFPSISGGHSLAWRDPENPRPRDVPPWDHIRGNQFPSGSSLNRMRESDYAAIFGARFRIVEARAKYEGREYLTQEIERECNAFSREELLKANVGYILRRV